MLFAAGCSSPQQSDGIREQALSTSSPPGSSGGASAAIAPPSSTGNQTVIAHVNGQPVTMRELTDPLIESRGLALLLNIAQLDLAKQDARDAHVIVTSDDI